MKFGMPGFVVPVVMSSREFLSIFDYGDGTFRTKLVTGKKILTDYLLKSCIMIFLRVNVPAYLQPLKKST